MKNTFLSSTSYFDTKSRSHRKNGELNSCQGEQRVPKRAWIVLCVYLFLSGATALATPQNYTHLMRYPDISKDNVVFSYAGDLWVCPRVGGVAQRLTSHPGDELYPKFSPNGKWIAFTGEYDGNQDVYVIPVEGGEPRRLTFHPSSDIVLGWTADGKKILFRSDRYSTSRAYTKLFLVSIDGGMPEELPIPRASLSSFSPDGNRIAYLPTSLESRYWKRYRGGLSPAIGIYDLTNNKYEELPRSNGMDLFPMWHENFIYFISDRNGVMNLYRYDLNTKRTEKLSDYTEYDIKWPSLGPDGIVYENGGLLYFFEIASGNIRNIPVIVDSENIQARAQIKDVSKGIANSGLSPGGVRAVFEARGNIFTVPVEHGSTRNLTNSSSIHALNPVWSPDGKWIAYLSDRTGEYELYIRPQKGGNEMRITADGRVYRYGPIWSPDTRKLLYWDKKQRLWYVDVDEKKPVLIDTGEDGPINGGAWSPDARWVAYNKPDRRGSEVLKANGFIFLYSLEQKKSFPVSSGFYSDSEPQFDQNGKYLYFLSRRFFHPSAGQFDTRRYNYYATDGVFAVTLRAGDASPFGPQSDEENAADPPTTEDRKEEKRRDAVMQTRIDTEGIQGRVATAPIPAGSYEGLQARKEKFFYLSVPTEAVQPGQPTVTPSQNVLHVFDVTKRLDNVLLAGIDNYHIDKEGDKILYYADGKFGVVDAVPGKARVGDGQLNTKDIRMLVDPREEWQQIFHEAWRIERDFYWDPAMGGVDWERIGKRYESLLPWVVDRSDLNYLIGEMIAELSTSHVYVQGGDQPDQKQIDVGLLGADFEVDHGFYRFKKIYPGENWNEETRSPLTEPGLKVKQGDYLLEVNGVAISSKESIYSYFQNLIEQVVTLRVSDKPSTDGAWDVIVKPIRSEVGVRYLDWVENNRRIVAEATGGRIGYMHVPDTFLVGIAQFDKQLNGQLGRDGMIVDERYNAGGLIPDFFTEKLTRNLLFMISGPDVKDQPWPPIAVYGPKVMIINELAGSGGDAFPWIFKREEIGPIVGKRTAGAFVAPWRDIPLRDGGSVSAPEFGFWSTDNGGEWIIENHGVDPDYDVDQRPDLVVAGHDPQLEKAIDLAKEALKAYPPVPPRPKYPKKN